MYFKYLIKTILFSFIFLLFISGSGGAQEFYNGLPNLINKDKWEITLSEGNKNSKIQSTKQVDKDFYFNNSGAEVYGDYIIHQLNVGKKGDTLIIRFSAYDIYHEKDSNNDSETSTFHKLKVDLMSKSNDILHTMLLTVKKGTQLVSNKILLDEPVGYIKLTNTESKKDKKETALVVKDPSVYLQPPPKIVLKTIKTSGVEGEVLKMSAYLEDKFNVFEGYSFSVPVIFTDLTTDSTDYDTTSKKTTKIIKFDGDKAKEHIISLESLNDGINEGSEKLQVKLGSAVDYDNNVLNIDTSSTGEFTIKDKAKIILSANKIQFLSNNITKNKNFKVSLSTQPKENVTVTIKNNLQENQNVFPVSGVNKKEITLNFTKDNWNNFQNVPISVTKETMTRFKVYLVSSSVDPSYKDLLNELEVQIFKPLGDSGLSDDFIKVVEGQEASFNYTTPKLEKEYKSHTVKITPYQDAEAEIKNGQIIAPKRVLLDSKSNKYFSSSSEFEKNFASGEQKYTIKVATKDNKELDGQRNLFFTVEVFGNKDADEKVFISKNYFYLAIMDNDKVGIKIMRHDDALGDDVTLKKYAFNGPDQEAKLHLLLASKPTHDVKIKLESESQENGDINKKFITFTPENWNVKQDFIVKSKNNPNAKSKLRYNINFITSSDDPNYDDLVDIFEIANDYTSGTTTSTTLISQKKVSKIISKYLDNKISLLLANQPDVRVRFSRLEEDSSSSGRISAFGGSASMQLPVTVGLNNKQAYFYGSLKSILNAVSGNNNVAQQNRFDVWTQGSISRFEGSVEKGTFGVLYGGADYVVHPNVLIGGIAQIDWIKQEGSGESADEVVKGFGWMIGPYGVVKLHKNVFANFRFAWGLSNNDIEVKEVYKDDFGTSRWLVTAALVGDYTFNNWNVRPAVRVNYLNENQASYVGKSGLKMPAQKQYQGVFKVGPRISHSFFLDSGAVAIPWLELEGEYLFAKKASILTTEKTKKNNLSGNIKLGFDFNFLGGATLAVSGNFGGFNSDLRKYGASLYLNIPITN